MVTVFWGQKSRCSTNPLLQNSLYSLVAVPYLRISTAPFRSDTRCSQLLQMSQLMRLWLFSSSVNSFFKRACPAIQWGKMSDFWSDPSSTSVHYVARLCGNAGSPEPSLVAYVISTIISWAGSNSHSFRRPLFSGINFPIISLSSQT